MNQQSQPQQKQRRPRIKQGKEVRRAKAKARRAKAAEVAAIQPEVKVKHNGHGKARVDRPYLARVWPVASAVNPEWPANRRALVLRRAVSRVFCIFMDPSGLRVTGIPMDAFDRDFVPEEYDVQKAARHLLHWGETLVGITDVARDALKSIVEGEVDMSSIEDKVAEQSAVSTPVGPTPKNSTKAGTTAKAKRPSKAVSVKGGGGKTSKKGKATTAVSKKGNGAAKPAAVSARKAAIDGNMKIKKLVKDNPRRDGSAGHTNWALYRDGMSVDKYLEQKGASPGHLRWDENHGYIKLTK